MDSADNLPEKSKNGKVPFTKEIEEKCVAACASGFTMEKCAGLVGVPVGTLKTWVHRNPSFGRKMETARKNHELALLRDVEQAGERSWQAKAWCLERIYSYAQPSARLQVAGSVEHKREIARIKWAGIFGTEKEFDHKRHHPTQKPSLLPQWFFNKWGKEKDLIADLFLGSGSTMVAAHQLKRKCYGMELDPKYCQVIIDRMIKLDPTLVIKKNGETYAKS